MIMMSIAATACKGILINNWKPYGRRLPFHILRYCLRYQLNGISKLVTTLARITCMNQESDSELLEFEE
jgi:hypothetical protein